MELWLLAAWAVSGALLLFTHLLLAWRVFSGPLDAVWRYLGVLVPFFTPIAAWRTGHRFAAVAWILLLLLYISLRLVQPHA